MGWSFFSFSMLFFPLLLGSDLFSVYSHECHQSSYDSYLVLELRSFLVASIFSYLVECLVPLVNIAPYFADLYVLSRDTSESP